MPFASVSLDGRGSATTARDGAELEALLRSIHHAPADPSERGRRISRILKRAAAEAGMRDACVSLAAVEGVLPATYIGIGSLRARTPDWCMLAAARARRAVSAIAHEDQSAQRVALAAPIVFDGAARGALLLTGGSPREDDVREGLRIVERYAWALSSAFAHVSLGAVAAQAVRERQLVEEELLDTIGQLRRSENALRLSHAETIARLATATESRSEETGSHVERMSTICAAVAERLGLDEDRVELLRVASALHDIGKIAIPDAILLKPGLLTRDERRTMATHAATGHRILSGSSSELLDLAATIALTHHERFDGTGYPNGLAGEAIPLAGRIAAVADVFDALTSDRVYRPRLPIAEATAIMRRGAGTQFDPVILETFFEILPQLDGLHVTLGSRRQPPVRAERRARAAMPVPRVSPHARSDARPLAPTALADGCREAITALGASTDNRAAIELAIERLCRTLDDRLIVSVYILDEGRLWLVSQRGYRDLVHDGFRIEHGVMARAVRTGEVQLVPDVSRDPDFIATTEGIVSELAVPFAHGSEASGVLNVETFDASLPEQAAEIFAPLADELADRIEAIRASLGLDVTSLAQICVHASSLRGVSAIAEFTTRMFGRLLHLESAQLTLERGAGSASLASFWRRPETQSSPVDLEVVAQLSADTDGTHMGARFGIRSAASLGLNPSEGRSIVWIPLRVRGGDVGHLVGRSRSADIELGRIEGAILLGQHAAALIDIAQLLRREQRAAVTDALTGLLNRRGFEERLRDEIGRADRVRTPLSLILVDCDRLKAINDEDGHEHGDAALAALAEALRTHKRSADVTARLGGDEFAVLLPDTDARSAIRIAERIRSGLRETAAKSGRRLTASFGVACHPHDGATTTALLAAADKALYEAKRRGGDRARVAA